MLKASVDEQEISAEFQVTIVIQDKIIEKLYLSFTPSDVEFEIGQAFSQTYGQIKGANSDQALMVVDLGSAAEFMTWDSDSNTLRVEEGATDISSIGEHTITMVIFD